MKTYRTKPDAYDKYALLIKNPWTVRVLYMAGLLSWIGVLYGYILFFQLNAWYWFIFGPAVAVFTVYYFLNYGINLFYRSFDVAKHNALVNRYWRGRKELPTVDIFVPVCGEQMAILEWTFDAVDRINYPEKKVYILDDKGDSEVERLAKKLGFSYLSREDKGVAKKAGNIKHGHQNSDGEFIVIFDADFAPHADFITELLPYMADPKVGVAQSPQHFPANARVHARSPLAFGSAHIQEDFYRIVQASRESLGGAICVGSNAIYRRSALDKIGGTAQVEHSEDILTGFNLVNAGYSVKYVPLVLAEGLCPESVHSYFQQQHRWCSGTMNLCLSPKFLLSKLTIGQKLCYLTGLLYYVTQLLSLFLVFQVYTLLFFHFDSISLRMAWPFLPHLLFSFIALPLFRKTKQRYGASLARSAQAFSVSHAVLSHLLGQGLDWQPTNGNKAKASVPFVALIVLNAAYLFAHVALLSMAIAMKRFPIFEINYYSVMFWVVYNLGVSSLFLFHGSKTMQELLKGDPRGRHSFAYAGLKAVGAFALLSVLATGSGVLYARRPIIMVRAVVHAETVEPAVAETVPVIETVEPVLPATETTYIETATAGDCLTRMYRRAFSGFIDDRGLETSDTERVFAETTLVAGDGRDAVNVGDEVRISDSELMDVYDAAQALTEQQKRAWLPYAATVQFD